jgi:hypothetical protein
MTARASWTAATNDLLLVGLLLFSGTARDGGQVVSDQRPTARRQSFAVARNLRRKSPRRAWIAIASARSSNGMYRLGPPTCSAFNLELIPCFRQYFQ